MYDVTISAQLKAEVEPLSWTWPIIRPKETATFPVDDANRTDMFSGRWMTAITLSVARDEGATIVAEVSFRDAAGAM